VFLRQTQTEEYWVRDFAVDRDDLEYIHNRLLEEERPLPIEELALAVMRYRVDKEDTSLQKMLAKGTVYRPADTYSVGEKLVFPALNFATAVVTAVRPGSNPEYGDFQVIQVEFGRSGRQREFASALLKPHPLNEEADRLLEKDGSVLEPEQLYDRYGRYVRQQLLVALNQQADLIELYGLWFLKALAVEIGPGHLNIAEAILDISGGGPVAPGDLLKDLDLPAEARRELLEFSLNYALDKDDRFDEVGPAGQVLWYLRRLEPPEVLAPPQRLKYEPISYDRSLLNLSLRKLEADLDDEWSLGWQPYPTPEPTTLTLTFPHWQQGTLPLSSRIAPLFPTAFQAPRIRCLVVDAETKEEIEAWVVWEGRFVYGLEDWYRDNQLPVGAYLHLSPGTQPGTILVDYERRRPQQEWIRVARVDGNKIIFGMQKRALGAAYDDMMTIGFSNPEAIDDIWVKALEQDWSLAQIMVRLFPELAKLSPQSTVHSKTVYSAVNVVRRCPPGPVFAELVRQPCFISMGENYWRFNPSLWTGE
jgi:hypothetical protein